MGEQHGKFYYLSDGGAGKIDQVAEELASMDDVSEVYSVGGRFDLVAIMPTGTIQEKMFRFFFTIR
jgi:DNA-binding Lrp family transcriptional regulator